MTKLEEMEALSQEAADRVKPILLDPRNPFVEVKFLDINKKDKALHEMAISAGVYYALHYGGNLKKLSPIVAVKNPFAAILLNAIGTVLEKWGKYWHLKQYKIG